MKLKLQISGKLRRNINLEIIFQSKYFHHLIMIDLAGSTNIQEVLLNLISIKYMDETKSKDTGPSFSHM